MKDRGGTPGTTPHNVLRALKGHTEQIACVHRSPRWGEVSWGGVTQGSAPLHPGLSPCAALRRGQAQDACPGGCVPKGTTPAGVSHRFPARVPGSLHTPYWKSLQRLRRRPNHPIHRANQTPGLIRTFRPRIRFGPGPPGEGTRPGIWELPLRLSGQLPPGHKTILAVDPPEVGVRAAAAGPIEHLASHG